MVYRKENIILEPPLTSIARIGAAEQFSFGFKEASYSRVPVGISLHVSIFPKIAVLDIHFMAYSSSH